MSHSKLCLKPSLLVGGRLWRSVMDKWRSGRHATKVTAAKVLRKLYEDRLAALEDDVCARLAKAVPAGPLSAKTSPNPNTNPDRDPLGAAPARTSTGALGALLSPLAGPRQLPAAAPAPVELLRRPLIRGEAPPRACEAAAAAAEQALLEALGHGVQGGGAEQGADGGRARAAGASELRDAAAEARRAFEHMLCHLRETRCACTTPASHPAHTVWVTRKKAVQRRKESDPCCQSDVQRYAAHAWLAQSGSG